jgi:Tol biopolymer transport system component
MHKYSILETKLPVRRWMAGALLLAAGMFIIGCGSLPALFNGTDTPVPTLSLTAQPSAMETPTPTPSSSPIWKDIYTVTPNRSTQLSGTLTRQAQTTRNLPTRTSTGMAGTATRTTTVTSTWSLKVFPSPTLKKWPTYTRTVTPYRTPTRTLTRTKTLTRTITRTRTKTLTRTVTRTRTKTLTQTVTMTRTATRTATLTATPTQTLTPTLTITASVTATGTATLTPTDTPTATATQSLPGGTIFYSQDSNSDGVGDQIWSLATDGSVPQLVYDSSGNVAQNVDISADHWLAFEGGVSMARQIYVLDLSAGAVSMAALPGQPAGENMQPAWDASGEWLVFSNLSAGRSDLFACARDGATCYRLSDDTAVDSQPDWSPDGSQVVYISNPGSTPALYSIDVSSPGVPPSSIPTPEQLYPDGSIEEAAAQFSADGNQLAFSRLVDGLWQVFRAAYPDGVAQQLTFDNADGFSPAWSPDGNWLAMLSHRFTGVDILILAGDGTGATRLTASSAPRQHPVWLP